MTKISQFAKSQTFVTELQVRFFQSTIYSQEDFSHIAKTTEISEEVKLCEL